MKLVKLLLFAFFIGVNALTAIAQVNTNAAAISDEWSMIHTQNGVNFYAKKAVCTLYEGVKPFDYVFLKVENTTNAALTVSFDLGTVLNGDCMWSATDEPRATLTVSANASVANDCSAFSKGLHGLIQNRTSKTINRFDGIRIANIQITK